MNKVTMAVMIVAGASALAGQPTMADLQALEKQGAWEELMQNLGAIAPAQRDAAWAGIAERGASGALGALDLETASDAEHALYTIDRLLKRYPTLKQSKVFMAKRADVGLTAFGRTAGESSHSISEDPWLDALKAFVAVDSVTPQLPQRAAKVVQHALIAEVAWPLWQRALSQGASVCADPEFKAALLMALADGAWPDETVPAATVRCWADLKVDLVEALQTTPSAEALKRLCAVAKVKDVKSPACQ